MKHERGAKQDTDLDGDALKEVIARYKKVVRDKTGKPFPQDPAAQLRGARDAVFRSWNNPRAREYRRIYDIPDDIGTAVNVQAMVFGNTGDRSATGVGFTRNPATGAHEFFGEFLVNAQGEDVVAGIRTPQPIAELEKVMPKAYKELRTITTRLEKHYKDIQDFEFTIQEDKLYMLQTRSGKRTGYAAVVIATDFVEEKLVKPRKRCSSSIPRRCRSCSRPASIRRNGRSCRSPPRGCRPRPARPPDRWSSPPTMRSSGPTGARRCCSCARRPCPTTFTACSCRRACSPRPAA